MGVEQDVAEERDDRLAHLEKLKSKIPTTNLFLDERRASLVHEEHCIGYATNRFVGGFDIILVYSSERE